MSKFYNVGVVLSCLFLKDCNEHLLHITGYSHSVSLYLKKSETLKVETNSSDCLTGGLLFNIPINLLNKREKVVEHECCAMFL